MQTTYIELAGIPIEVRSQYNSDFLQEFITYRTPLLKVEPGEEDLDRMRKVLDLERRLIRQAAFYRMGCNTESEAALVAWEGMHADMC